MILVKAGELTFEMRALFDEKDPASIRCFAVLEGTVDGQVWVDDLARPNRGIVQENGFGSVYFGGQIDRHAVAVVFNRLRSRGEVLVGLPIGDPRFELLPDNPEFVGRTVEFSDRSLGSGAEAGPGELPPGCQLVWVDGPLFERCLERELLVSIFGTAEKALENSFGLCLLRGEQILSEAHAGPVALGMIEIGTMTHERHRFRGYATLTCAHLIHACEQMGLKTYWNCAKHNKASVALAHKLGYASEFEYELRAWFG